MGEAARKEYQYNALRARRLRRHPGQSLVEDVIRRSPWGWFGGYEVGMELCAGERQAGLGDWSL
jgi:hypothetical protein